MAYLIGSDVFLNQIRPSWTLSRFIYLLLDNFFIDEETVENV